MTSKHLIYSLALFTSCAAFAQDFGAAPKIVQLSTPESIKVGAIYAMTGEWASWGKNCQQGIQLALEERQQQNMAPKFDFVLEDSPSAKAMNALTMWRRVISQSPFSLEPKSGSLKLEGLLKRGY